MIQLEKKRDWDTTRLSARAVIINASENNTCLKVINFADDTMLLKTFTKDTYLNDSKSFNAELSKVSDWLIVNNLKLNPDKTKLMLLNQSENVFDIVKLLKYNKCETF